MRDNVITGIVLEEEYDNYDKEVKFPGWNSDVESASLAYEVSIPKSWGSDAGVGFRYCFS